MPSSRGGVELGAGAGAGDDDVRLLGHRARHLGPEALGHGLGLLARHLLQRAREDHRLAGHGALAGHRLQRLRRDLLQQRVDDLEVVRLAEEVGDGLGHHGPDALDGVELAKSRRPGLRRRPRRPPRKVLDASEMPRQHLGVGLADMADAEREDEAVERHAAPRLDGGEEVAHRGLAVALAVVAAAARSAASRASQREDVLRRA